MDFKDSFDIFFLFYDLHAAKKAQRNTGGGGGDKKSS